MKKLAALTLTFILAICSLTACGSRAGADGSAQNAGVSGDKIQVVTTIFPEYDWVMSILGDRADKAELTMLLDNGVDLHSYQPTAQDILKISTCDIFIYVGGESDGWVDDALKEAVNKDMQVINLLEVLGDKVKEEEVVEGMQGEEEEEHEHEHEDGDEDEEAHEHEEVEYDEHVWLSLKNAQVLCDKIADALAEVDAEGADVYKKNATDYDDKLAALDAEYKAVVDAASVKTVLFGDRFPFRYLTDDYGLSYYAAFVGCSAETEASFETVIFLADKTDELNLPAIMTIEGSDQRIAQTVRDNTTGKDQKILTLDSLQSTTSDDVKAGKTYLTVMTDNLAVLKEALNS